MNKLILLTILFSASYTVSAQTLLTIGKETISKQQFFDNFKKNYTQVQGSKLSSIKENLTLFIKYKLKVKAAYDEKLDTLQNQKDDLINFRRQIEGKYLTEEKMMKSLVAEAHQRMQKDIRISHIITLFEKNGDTTMAYKKILEAYKKLKKGEPFETVATLFSEDQSVTENKGDLGFVNVFTLPYDLETLAYNTPLLKFSAIYKSKFGYHIIKKSADRPALGTMEAAQILIQNIAGSEAAANKAKADMVYQKLKAGDNFENLAKAYSNDMYSAQSGGILQSFTVGKYDAVFESAFGALKDAEISKPFETAFGWHILKRIKCTPPSKILTSDVEQEILAKINNDARKQRAEDLFVQNIMKQVNYKTGLIIPTDLIADADAKIKDLNAKTKTDADAVIHTFNNTYKVKAGDFFSFTTDAQRVAAYKGMTTEKLLAEYVKVTAKEFYKNNLEQYNTEYKNQLKEFKDGNLLFEIMERNVWNKSATDEEGLKIYYEKNKQKYVWTPSADAVIFNGSNLSEMNALSGKINIKNKEWQDALRQHENYVRADSGRYETANIPVPDRTAFAEGTLTTAFSPNNDGNYVFAFILKMYPEGAIKSFDDAKGLVINDYQNTLEETWIEELKKKYNVKLNEAVWSKILKSIK